MKYLWLAWKDINHPAAGGAERVLWELSKRLLADSHEVTILTCGYANAPATETLDGISIIRVGSSRYLHPFQALWYYLRHLRNRFDVVVETVNTAVYFAVLFGGRAKRFLFYHQLAREIWFYETKPPLSHLGYYVLEPLANWLLSLSRVPVITVSESTKRDLERFGFAPDIIHIITEGIHIDPVQDLDGIEKYPKPTLLSHGAVRAMKRTLDQVAAFEAAKASLPDMQLKISGSTSDPYAKQVLERIAASPYKADIEVLGRTSDEQKTELMQRCHAIAVTSIKEGWGLIVSEANSQGTPAVVYDVDGLRDSVRHNQTGIVTATNPTALASGIVQLLSDPTLYTTTRQAAWEWSKTLTFDRCYSDFTRVIAVPE